MCYKGDVFDYKNQKVECGVYNYIKFGVTRQFSTTNPPCCWMAKQQDGFVVEIGDLKIGFKSFLHSNNQRPLIIGVEKIH